jgi:hypothetical protein
LRGGGEQCRRADGNGKTWETNGGHARNPGV